MKKTGGGPSPPELKPWEEKIVAVLSNYVISGVEGGFESLSVMSPMDNCMPGCSKKRKFATMKDKVLEIEEEKLRIMKEQLDIEKKKLQILEDYVLWRKQQDISPSVSPVIKGLINL
ncbi:uncharacterized protein LOC134231435 [Saccostrea cucullata]|uniref:uncharacterized protein LOC134231435 n=1 Tax=Saccostrea cuccullata TaxID=36930 RepID=UPI002ED082C5